MGRGDEVRGLVHRVGGARSRIVVQADARAGMTSFGNRVRHDLACYGGRTHDQPIRITAETTLQSFVGDVLRVLLAMHAAPLGTDRAGQRSTTTDPAYWGKITRVAEGRF